MRMPKLIFQAYLSGLLISSVAQGSGTVVGNGGEPVLHFLEATRFSVVETIRTLHNDPSKMKLVCMDQKQLSMDQKEFCQKFFEAIHTDLILLNTLNKPVEFVLRQEPLLVEGPDGQKMPVSARTQLGPLGPIEFHFDSIKLMPPRSMFHLLLHELEHKVSFQGNPITDNGAIGPFDSGRKLIDAVAASVSAIAIEQGRIAQQFFLLDNFDCQIESGGSPVGFRTRAYRMFFDDTLTNYKTSIGDNPYDGEIYLTESINTKLVYGLSIKDKNHCLFPADKSLRSTKISLWRVNNDVNIKPELLSENTLEGINPFCEKQSLDLPASVGPLKFNCRYYGTQGISNMKTKVRP